MKIEKIKEWINSVCNSEVIIQSLINNSNKMKANLMGRSKEEPFLERVIKDIKKTHINKELIRKINDFLRGDGPSIKNEIKLLKEVTGHRRIGGGIDILLNNGKEITNKKEISKAIADHFRDLAKGRPEEEIDFKLEEMKMNVLMDNVRHVAKRVKKGKATSDDMIDDRLLEKIESDDKTAKYFVEILNNPDKEKLERLGTFMGGNSPQFQKPNQDNKNKTNSYKKPNDETTGKHAPPIPNKNDVQVCE
jgi:hypothetical protein